jgi:hypothetical protein
MKQIMDSTLCILLTIIMAKANCHHSALSYGLGCHGSQRGAFLETVDDRVYSFINAPVDSVFTLMWAHSFEYDMLFVVCLMCVCLLYSLGCNAPSKKQPFGRSEMIMYIFMVSRQRRVTSQSSYVMHGGEQLQERVKKILMGEGIKP